MEDFKAALQDYLSRRLAAAGSGEKRDAYRAVQWFILDYELGGQGNTGIKKRRNEQQLIAPASAQRANNSLFPL